MPSTPNRLQQRLKHVTVEEGVPLWQGLTVILLSFLVGIILAILAWNGVIGGAHGFLGGESGPLRKMSGLGAALFFWIVGFIVVMPSASYLFVIFSKGRRRKHWSETFQAYLFLAPAFFILLTFGILPVVYAFYISLHRWRVIPGRYIKFSNYIEALGKPTSVLIFVVGVVLILATWLLWGTYVQRGGSSKLKHTPSIVWHIGRWLLILAGLWIAVYGLLGMIHTGDDQVFNSFLNTIYYSIGTIPLQLAVSLVLAYVLFQGLKGQELFRMLFFMPYIAPSVATAAVFTTLFTPRPEGLVNRLIGFFGIPAQKWLFEASPINVVIAKLVGIHLPVWVGGPSMAMVSIILYNTWVFFGYYTVIFLAGLGNIPEVLYEAARLDGANQWTLFRRITIPLLSPTTFFLSMIGVIGTFKAFTHIYVMRVPSALGTVDTVSIVIFDQFFNATRYGYASAIAFVLFAVILFLTVLQNHVFGRKVFYG